ncbi:putative transposase domain protein [Mycobacterium xenopi 4042]|uniref:Putative transposase domain protein n=1 Tax=Mycobacterium xenopi 4042 TaxID=1299334 RepID=X8A8J5_MYCXE|nr:putative transposase domain protein [Mycobacterium xenopi 4042]
MASPKMPCGWRRVAPGVGRPRCSGGIYVDNGSAFVDAWLLRACAKLGVRLVHSAPGRPKGGQGRTLVSQRA